MSRPPEAVRKNKCKHTGRTVRGEIVAALALHRKTKAAPGEIESALALYRNARKLLGIEPPPDDDQPTA